MRPGSYTLNKFPKKFWSKGFQQWLLEKHKVKRDKKLEHGGGGSRRAEASEKRTRPQKSPLSVRELGFYHRQAGLIAEFKQGCDTVAMPLPLTFSSQICVTPSMKAFPGPTPNPSPAELPAPLCILLTHHRPLCWMDTVSSLVSFIVLIPFPPVSFCTGPGRQCPINL